MHRISGFQGSAEGAFTADACSKVWHKLGWMLPAAGMAAQTCGTCGLALFASLGGRVCVQGPPMLGHDPQHPPQHPPRACRTPGVPGCLRCTSGLLGPQPGHHLRHKRRCGQAAVSDRAAVANAMAARSPQQPPGSVHTNTQDGSKWLPRSPLDTVYIKECQIQDQTGYAYRARLDSASICGQRVLADGAGHAFSDGVRDDRGPGKLMKLSPASSSALPCKQAEAVQTGAQVRPSRQSCFRMPSVLAVTNFQVPNFQVPNLQLCPHCQDTLQLSTPMAQADSWLADLCARNLQAGSSGAVAHCRRGAVGRLLHAELLCQLVQAAELDLAAFAARWSPRSAPCQQLSLASV